MELLADLDAFYLEHRRCGELDSDLSEGTPVWVVMVCSCGGRLARRIDEEFVGRRGRGMMR
jgi:hypothetical protein